jgi:ABC transport system ATP-binding/permease protein
MRRARSQRIEMQGKANLAVDAGDLAGKLVADLRHVSFRYGDHWIVRNLSTRILRGDRVGIIGPNGSGKSTLLRLILGEIKPVSGEIIMGTRLQLAYFDQQRTQLDPEKTVRENISEGKDYIAVRRRLRHVIGYLKDFLFPPERIDSPVKVLSGGERNRLLLAKMFTRPANMMVLDEPTNDLDVDTLELLEDLLADYDGTLLLVSHDRTFLDNVVTSTLVFEDDGSIGEYIGGYDDWLRQRKPAVTVTDQGETEKVSKGESKQDKSPARKQKLSYKEGRELEALPARIEALEQEQLQLEQQLSQGEFYQQHKEVITRAVARLEQVREELEQAYGRWTYLEGIG